MSEEDLRLLITLDDPWNAQECDTFYSRQAEHTDMYRPGQPGPTRGRHDHRAVDIIDNYSFKMTSNTPAEKGHYHERY